QLLSLWSKKEDLEKVKLQSMLNHIDTAVNNVLDLMNDILQFSKPETVKKENVDLHKLISDLLNLLSSSLDKHHIQYQVEMPEWTILGDSKLIQQALLNIVQNAIEAFYEFADERKIEFRGQENNSTRCLEIYNNGPLIQQDNLDKVFDTFFSTKGSNGTGLGLSITREIIEKIHGGRISCISDEKNKGTSFIIEFPRITEIDQVVDY
ncbi:MAG: HAMP domain-containing histidine kinase, partial [Desulfobacterales bacterium]|nr:HAMP domain-containing histidine kinase [Desulfobacterales bacterium]